MINTITINTANIETDKKAKRPIADTTDKTDKSDDNNTAKRRKTEKKTALENAKAIYEAFFMSGRATMTKEQIADHEKELAALLTNFVDELGRKPEERDQEKFLLQVRRKKPTDPRLESLENLVQEVDSRTLRTLIALLKDLTPIEAATTSILEPIMKALAKMEAKVDAMVMVNFNKEFVAAYGSLTKDDSKAHDDAITCIMEVMQAKVTKVTKKKKSPREKKSLMTAWGAFSNSARDEMFKQHGKYLPNWMTLIGEQWKSIKDDKTDEGAKQMAHWEAVAAAANAAAANANKSGDESTDAKSGDESADAKSGDESDCSGDNEEFAQKIGQQEASL